MKIGARLHHVTLAPTIAAEGIDARLDVIRSAIGVSFGIDHQPLGHPDAANGPDLHHADVLSAGRRRRVEEEQQEPRDPQRRRAVHRPFATPLARSLTKKSTH